MEHQTRIFDTMFLSLPELSYTFDLHGRFSCANKTLAVLLELALENLSCGQQQLCDFELVPVLNQDRPMTPAGHAVSSSYAF